jgi:hypothetical protein
MKYPQRWQTILQRCDSRRLEQTGQNWLGNSGAVGECAKSEAVGWGVSLFTLKLLLRLVVS